MIHIAIIPGDGIGPEVIQEVLPLLSWALEQGVPLQWQGFPYGADHFLATGETLSEEHFRQLRDDFDGILFGAVGDPRIPDGRHAEAILLRLRQELSLAVNYRPCKPNLDELLPIKNLRAADIDIEVFRENTEGPYCLQGESSENRGVDLAIHTREAVERLLRAAFERALKRDSTLTLAHKSNVLKHGHGLWMRVFQELREHFPSVNTTTIHADALLCELVRNPTPFGVIAADNFVGDLVSDLLAAFQGGMGMAPSASWAPHAPFRCRILVEPVHGSAPNIAGKNLANPSGAILSFALLLRHFGYATLASRIETAVQGALKKGACTLDLGGSLNDGRTLSCTEMGEAIRKEVGISNPGSAVHT